MVLPIVCNVHDIVHDGSPYSVNDCVPDSVLDSVSVPDSVLDRFVSNSVSYSVHDIVHDGAPASIFNIVHDGAPYTL